MIANHIVYARLINYAHNGIPVIALNARRIVAVSFQITVGFALWEIQVEVDLTLFLVLLILNIMVILIVIRLLIYVLMIALIYKVLRVL